MTIIAFTPVFGSFTNANPAANVPSPPADPLPTPPPTTARPPATPTPSAMNALLNAWLQDATREVQPDTAPSAVSDIIANGKWWRTGTTQPSDTTEAPQTSALYRSLYFRGQPESCATNSDTRDHCVASVPDFLLLDNSAVGIGLLDEVREIWREKSESGKRHVLSHVLGAIGVVAMMVNPLRN